MALFNGKTEKQADKEEKQTSRASGGSGGKNGTSGYEKPDGHACRDPETGEIVSAYLRGRKAKRLGRAILRMGRIRVFLLCAVSLVLLLFAIAFMQEKTGNFTINLDRLGLFRKGISMSSDAAFSSPTARLTASPIENVTNISAEDIPADVDDIDGDHNGSNYMAYTYYVRNAGKEPVSYRARVAMDSATKGAEDAARVAVWKNGEKTVYAMPAADGGSEEGCTDFVSRDLVCEYSEDNFDVGYVDKYTIVIWIDGDDPECVDKIIGGGMEFSMKLEAATEDDSTLLDRFIGDLMDAISGDPAIGAAGTESPDYSENKDINWFTRNNR